jgi:hypothetical protein
MAALLVWQTLMPQAVQAVDYVIDGTGGDCTTLGGVWDGAAIPPVCTVNTVSGGNPLTLSAGDKLTVRSGVAFHVAGHGNVNAGTIENSGIVGVGTRRYCGGGEMLNRGVISNSGTLQIGMTDGSECVVGAYFWDVITNTGVITNLATGVIRIPSSDRIIPYSCCGAGVLENAGTLANAGSFHNEGHIRNLGRIDNAPGGVIAVRIRGWWDPLGRGGGTSISLFENGGEIRNAGTVDNLGGTVKNSGVFSNTATFTNMVEYLVEKPPYQAPTYYRLGTVDNGGTIVNAGSITVCNVPWYGNAPEGNPVTDRRCNAFFPWIGASGE